MQRKLHFLFPVVLILVAAATALADDLDDFVKSVMQQRHIPAASIAVVKDGVVVKTAAYGLANMELQVTAQPETVFKIGSVSKQFIAAGIMLLVQDGRIAVDDKLSRHLEGTPSTWRDITIRHLLSHTSGLPREAPGFDPYKIQPDIDVIKSAYPLPLQFKPGEKYDYSNLGYYTLAEVIHKLSGKSWGDFLNERVFVPLGMNSTRVTSALDIVSRRADGYVWSEDKFMNAENWLTVRPSGAFLSTAVDMAKWEVALQTDRILKASSKTAMWTPVTLNDGKKYPYGFGWELDDFPPGGLTTGVPSIRHEGTIPGFRAAYTRLPKHGLSVIVLSNLDRAALDLLVAGIAVRYVPELMPAALQRWEPSALK
jgi:D-alanyl-D-alanine carboxypeptidase